MNDTTQDFARLAEDQKAVIARLTAELAAARANITTLEGCVERMQPTVEETRTMFVHRINGGDYVSALTYSAENRRRITAEGRVRALEHEAKVARSNYDALKARGAGAPAMREISRLRRRLAAITPLLMACRRLADTTAGMPLPQASADVRAAFLAATAAVLPSEVHQPGEPPTWRQLAGRLVDGVMVALAPPITPELAVASVALADSLQLDRAMSRAERAEHELHRATAAAAFQHAEHVRTLAAIRAKLRELELVLP